MRIFESAMPKSTQPKRALRERFASVALTNSEYELLEAAAAKEERTISFILRRFVKSLAPKRAK